MLNKFIVMLAIILAFTFLMSCDNKNNNSSTPDIIKDLIVDYYVDLSRYIKEEDIGIVEVESYKEGYLCLVYYSGEGPGIELFKIEKSGDKFKISEVCSGEMAITMGTEINKVEDDSSTIIFGNLNKSTGIPQSDKSKETDFEKMKVELDNNEFIEENIKDRLGYLVVIKNSHSIKDVKFYNSKNEIVHSSEDIGITEKAFRIHQNIN